MYILSRKWGKKSEKSDKKPFFHRTCIHDVIPIQKRYILGRAHLSSATYTDYMQGSIYYWSANPSFVMRSGETVDFWIFIKLRFLWICIRTCRLQAWQVLVSWGWKSLKSSLVYSAFYSICHLVNGQDISDLYIYFIKFLRCKVWFSKHFQKVKDFDIRRQHFHMTLCNWKNQPKPPLNTRHTCMNYTFFPTRKIVNSLPWMSHSLWRGMFRFLADIASTTARQFPVGVCPEVCCWSVYHGTMVRHSEAHHWAWPVNNNMCQCM